MAKAESSSQRKWHKTKLRLWWPDMFKSNQLKAVKLIQLHNSFRFAASAFAGGGGREHMFSSLKVTTGFRIGAVFITTANKTNLFYISPLSLSLSLSLSHFSTFPISLSFISTFISLTATCSLSLPHVFSLTLSFTFLSNFFVCFTSHFPLFLSLSLF